MSFLKESFKIRPDLQVAKLIVSKAEEMNGIKSNSMDLVVHTFTLCSVDKYELVLDQIYRVLKPGGVCVFIEHSLDCQNIFRKSIQKLIAPLWFMLFDCQFKDIKTILSKSKYRIIDLNETCCLGYISDPIVYGFGKK